MSNNTQEKHAPHFYCLEKKPMRGAFFKMDFSRLGIRASLRGFYGMLTRITVFETAAGAQSRVIPAPGLKWICWRCTRCLRWRPRGLVPGLDCTWRVTRLPTVTTGSRGTTITKMESPW